MGKGLTPAIHDKYVTYSNSSLKLKIMRKKIQMKTTEKL